MRSMRWYRCTLLAGSIGLAACGENASMTDLVDSSHSDGARSTSGVALRIDVLSNTDVSGFVFDVTSCPGTGNVSITTRRSLEDLVIPSAGGTPPNSMLDSNSRHLFADYFQMLAPGCYDIHVTPVRDSPTGNVPSADCIDVTARNLQVTSGRTTEIVLISQCTDHGDPGAIDVIVAINHPPRIEQIAFENGKFVCEDDAFIVCATAYDPDGDPIMFDFFSDVQMVQVSEGACECTPREAHASITACWSYHESIESVGVHSWHVNVYDLMENGMRFEDYLRSPPPSSTQVGNPNAISHASMEGPFYVVDQDHCLN